MSSEIPARRLSKKQRLIGLLLLIVGVPTLAWTFGAAEFTAKWFAARAIARRDYRLAQEWADRAHAWNPQDAEAEFLLARVARKSGQLDESMRHLQRAAALGLARDRVVRESKLASAQIGQLSGVLNDLPNLLMNQEGDAAEISEAFVNGYLINGQTNEALLLIKSWREDYPNDPLPDCLWGRLSEHARQMTESEEHFRAALKRDPKHAMSVFGLARVLGERNQWQEAAELYRSELTGRVPAPAQTLLARCLRNLGREAEAIELLRIAEKTDPNVFDEELRRIGESTENDALATELGFLEARQGRHTEAIRWLRRAMQRNPKHREARYQLAQSLNAAGEKAEAQKLFQIIMETDEKLRELDRVHDLVLQKPNDLEAQYQLGLLVYETTSEQVGLYWLRSVLARDPNHAGAKAAIAAHVARQAQTDQTSN